MSSSTSEAMKLATVSLAISTELFVKRKSAPSWISRILLVARKSSKHLLGQLKAPGLPSSCSPSIMSRIKHQFGEPLFVTQPIYPACISKGMNLNTNLLRGSLNRFWRLLKKTLYQSEQSPECKLPTIRYHRFLSHGNTNTMCSSTLEAVIRYRFTGSLFKALRDKKIHTFMDDVGLHRRNGISRTLIEAIKGSRIAIIVFSENYADSTYCLDELVKILECQESDGQIVFPVFYDVSHNDVRHQTGSYGEGIAKHEEKFKDDPSKVQKWKRALNRAADFTGFVFEGNKYEHEFIGKIVEVVLREIKRVSLHADYPIGLESQVSEVKSLLFSDGYDGVHMVGIYGNAGSGKTTIAHAIYHLIANGFESICFLENVRENSYKHGLVHLQNILLSNIFERKNLKSRNIEHGISTIQHWLQQKKKTLLILDDVDKIEQLQALAGKPDWFGRGTRVIVTTRDKHLLESHGIERIYVMENSNSESNISASAGKDKREQLGEKSTFGDQVNGSLEPLVSEDISLERRKQASVIQGESNTEVIGCNENQADICHTHFPERIDNGQKEVPNEDREVDMVEKSLSAQLESLEEKKRELKSESARSQSMSLENSITN
ncbi:disease resistance protein RPV1-like [Arachis duranensis]|uniref:Disease resistance protein RPV1-like n=1 Tax=Arachis duranensis TaxID=130453 RepID=A0A9C6TJI7_ARADU|nr:disease resistance protein RPV1-like [Arachis duranensis]